jgi:hypothetical protein
MFSKKGRPKKEVNVVEETPIQEVPVIPIPEKEEQESPNRKLQYQIMSGELNEETGLIEYRIVSEASLGEIGERFDIE